MNTAVIVGGGAAGCQCALWLTMLGFEVLLVDHSHQLGGLQKFSPYLNNWIVGVMDTSGSQLAAQIQQHIQSMKIPHLLNQSVTSLKQTSNGFSLMIDHREVLTQYLVIATGVSPKTSGLTPSDDVIIGPGESVFTRNYRNQRVAILGGGDNAAENYAFIKEKNPACCHVYARSIRARKNLWEQIAVGDVFHATYQVDQHSMSITCDDIVREYDLMIVLYGWKANFPDFLNDYQSQLLNHHGYIQADESCRTTIPGIFAIGEVSNRMHPCVVTAMADGVVAAKAIQAAIESQS